MALRRDVSRQLLQAFDDENRFVQLVGAFVETGKMKPKEAEKTIIRWFQENGRLFLQLHEWSTR